MPVPGHKQRRAAVCAVLLAALAALGPGVASAAAGPPALGEVWASSITSSTVRLQAQINPEGTSTGYHIDYIPSSAYEANVAAGMEPFAGTKKAPPFSDFSIGNGTIFVAAAQQIGSLSAETPYRYRVVATSSAGSTETTPPLTFVTQSNGGGSTLADGRGWEMVSPVDKNGGQVAPPGSLAGGGVAQAAADGQSVTYGSRASFGGGAQGAATASQYVASRTEAGWSTQNITAPLYSGSYGAVDEGVPYQLFSGDLARALMLNGSHCRNGGTGCAVPNPPLAGTDAPDGYQNYYLGEGGSYTALLGAAVAGWLTLEPADFELRFAGSSADLHHVVLSTCAALTGNATEVPLGQGCDPDEANLYEYSPGAGINLVNVLPAQTNGTPGATLGAQTGAISADGSRVYWQEGGNLYLRESGTSTVEVEAGAEFQTASADGSVAFFTKGGHLYRYAAVGAGSSTDLTPAGEVQGVLGASEDGSSVYYLTGAGLFLWRAGATTRVASGADPTDYPPATGTARTSPDGTHLLFVATASLTGYDNKDAVTGNPDPEVYLYSADDRTLTCVSCNPTMGRPLGPSTIPGAVPNGTALGSTDAYKPRVLSADGRRVFFDSRDTLVAADTNNDEDAYEWEASGEGSCTRGGGCIALISSGTAEGGAAFVDASTDGSNAFFVTDGSLVGTDAGGVDLYDARVGGGFPEPGTPTPCEGDACQSLPSAPVEPTLTTLLSGLGNPPVTYPKARKHCKKDQRKQKGKCVKKAKKKTKSRHRRHVHHGNHRKGGR